MTSSVAEQLIQFRKDAYFKSPDFGARVDQLILQGQGLGDADPDTVSLADSLTALSTGLAQAAQAANLSVASYYDAQTKVAQIQKAASLGLTTTQYAAAQQATSGTVNPATANAFGIPIWAIFGGLALALIAFKPSHGRRR